jgi:hypothetical protein
MAKAPRVKRPAGAKAAPSKSKSAPAKSGAAKSSSPKPAARPKAAPAPSVHGGYPVICSECYTDFVFNPKTTATQVTCPVCMHVGGVAERDAQAKFQIAKGRERKKFMGGLIPGVLFLATGLVWMFLLNRAGSAEALGAPQHYGLLGVTLILFITTVFQGVKYESARYEVYF